MAIYRWGNDDHINNSELLQIQYVFVLQDSYIYESVLQKH